MVILITGANGQLGNEMRRVSAQSSNRYIFTDVAELDITDREAVLAYVEAEKVEVIVNCAAYTNVEKAEEDYERADLLNNRAVENLALAARAVGATMIHVSTDYVFKGDNCVPYFEDMDTDPLGVYGSTKLAGERALIASGCRYLIFRTAWLYSPFGNNFVYVRQDSSRQGHPPRGAAPFKGGHRYRPRVRGDARKDTGSRPRKVAQLFGRGKARAVVCAHTRRHEKAQKPRFGHVL